MLIGRAREKARLLDYYRSGKAELIAVYGRRRVGKTHLVRETFGNDFFFAFTGTTAIKTAAVSWNALRTLWPVMKASPNPPSKPGMRRLIA